MIRVIVELDKYGLGIERTVLGEIEIFNTGAGSNSTGQYGTRALAKRTRRVTREGSVQNHPRLREPVWSLVRKALVGMGY